MIYSPVSIVRVLMRQGKKAGVISVLVISSMDLGSENGVVEVPSSTTATSLRITFNDKCIVRIADISVRTNHEPQIGYLEGKVQGHVILSRHLSEH